LAAIFGVTETAGGGTASDDNQVAVRRIFKTGIVKQVLDNVGVIGRSAKRATDVNAAAVQAADNGNRRGSYCGRGRLSERQSRQQ
jgi:hypothetical protein